MNVVGVSTKSLVPVKDEPKKYVPSKSIYLYDETPGVEMSLDQFEIFALKRLKVIFNIVTTESSDEFRSVLLEMTHSL